MELVLAARRQVTQSQVAKYAKGTRAEKQAILDHLCAVNGWHRDHARKALRRASAGPPGPRRPRDPAYVYGPEVIEALRFCWAVEDGPTGKRLAPVMGLLVDSLRRHGELVISDRAQLVLKGRSMTKPGTLLKSQIPIRSPCRITGSGQEGVGRSFVMDLRWPSRPHREPRAGDAPPRTPPPERGRDTYVDRLSDDRRLAARERRR